MTKIVITEKDFAVDNLLYVQSSLAELFGHTDCKVSQKRLGSRAVFEIECPIYYEESIRAELNDKLAEIIAVNYKYAFFKDNIKVSGLNEVEKEILFASLIAADLDDDKKYSAEKLKDLDEIALDGIYNFRLKPLKKKWNDIVSYMPSCFINEQLKEFVLYLIEGRKKRVYIDDGNVYDMYYRRLKRSELLDKNAQEGRIIKEVILSGCGEVELNGEVPKTDEYYLKEFFTDKIIFSKRCFL